MSSIGYLIAAGWVASWALLVWFAGVCNGGWLAELERACVERGFGRSRARVAFAVSLLLAALVAPIAWLILLASTIHVTVRECRQTRRLLRYPQEYALEWRRPDELARSTRRALDEATERFKQIGFTPVGTYLMKPLPEHYYGRLLLGNDRLAYGFVGRMGEDLVQPSISTLFTDGRLVETALVEPFSDLKYLEQQDRHNALFAGEDCPLEVAYAQHRAAVEQLAEQHGSRPIRLTPASVTDAVRYEGWSYAQLLYDTGRYREPPTAHPLPVDTPEA